jgi:hypothetical protein
LGPLPGWKDRLLEFAYTLYVEGMCDCGRPKLECRNDENRGQYVAADITCWAQAAIEEHTGQKGFKPEPGQRFYAMEIDEELIARRTFAPAPRLDAAEHE